MSIGFSDFELIQKVVHDDERAFLLLYDRFASHVYGITLRVLGDSILPEEATQDTFLKLWGRARQFIPSQGALVSWLLTIAHRTALDRLKLENRRIPASNAYDPEEFWSKPGTQILTVNTNLTTTTGSILFHKEMATAVLILWNLPELEASQTYQIWLIDADDEKISSGLFLSSTESDYTTASVQSSFPIGQFAAVGITVEPSGGSQQPTSSPVVVVEL